MNKAGFSAAFPPPAEIDALWRTTYTEVHHRHAAAQPPMTELMK